LHGLYRPSAHSQSLRDPANLRSCRP
jgi:hypothetical protein